MKKRILAIAASALLLTTSLAYAFTFKTTNVKNEMAQDRDRIHITNPGAEDHTGPDRHRDRDYQDLVAAGDLTRDRIHTTNPGAEDHTGPDMKRDRDYQNVVAAGDLTRDRIHTTNPGAEDHTGPDMKRDRDYQNTLA